MTSTYEIQIKGHLDSEWVDWFTGFNLTHQSDGTTLLQGVVSDQPALHGLLMRINQLGLTLIRVEQIHLEGNDE